MFVGVVVPEALALIIYLVYLVYLFVGLLFLIGAVTVLVDYYELLRCFCLLGFLLQEFVCE
jgi:hypothetical protein